ncbi:MAG: hypothetical protein PVSMB8_10090 [Vulcanimicrobiaceae bacterium]
MIASGLAIVALVQAIVVAVGGSCGAERTGDYGVACPTPIRARVDKGCAVTASDRRSIAKYYDRTSLHHRAQLRYAFPRDESGQPMLAIFLRKPVSGTPDSYEVLNAQSAQSESLVYERCGNMVHAGAPYRI